MFKVSKRMEIAGAHKLDLPYESKCSNIHGHNWIIEITCISDKLTEYGMIVDFKKIKEAIHGVLDHQYINNIVKQNPTAEYMAYWIACEITKILKEENPYASVEKVTVQESEGNIAEYNADSIGVVV